MSQTSERARFRFKVLRKYDARLRGNEPHVTLNVLAGEDDHLVFCGTLTMSEREWAALKERLAVAFGDDFEVEEERQAAS
jgi:hypothetical protein